MLSDAHFDSAPMPLLPNAAFGINNNIKNASTDRNASKNRQKTTDSNTDDNPTNPNNNTPLSPDPLDIDMDDHSMLAPSHIKSAHSTQNTKKQIDIITFSKHLKGLLNDQKVTPAKQSIPYRSINGIISGKKTFPHLSKNKADTWVMDEEEISVLPEQVIPSNCIPPMSWHIHTHLTVMRQCRTMIRMQS